MLRFPDRFRPPRLHTRINPHGIRVFHAVHFQLKREPARGFRLRQGDANRPQPRQRSAGRAFSRQFACEPRFPANQRIAQRAAKRPAAVIRHADFRLQRFARFIAVARQQRQRQHAVEERAEPIRPRKVVRLGLQMAVEHADERRALPGEILQAQQRNAGHLLRAQHGLDLRPVAQARKFARRLHAAFPFPFQPCLLRPVADQGKVVRPRHAVERVDFVKVRQHLVLPHFEAENGLFIFLAQLRHHSRIIKLRIRGLMVQHALHFGKRRAQILLPEAGRGVKIALAVAAALPIEGVGAVCIQARGIRMPRKVQQLVHAFHALFARHQLVAERQHHKRRMICKREQRLPQLLRVTGIALIRFKRRMRIPVRKLGLHHHAQPVRRFKRGLGRRMRMKAHAVHAVRAIRPQRMQPCVHVHRPIARFRKNGAVRLAPQENHAAVERQPSAAVIAEIAHAEGYAPRIQPFARCAQLVEETVVLVPPMNIRPQREIARPDFLCSPRSVRMYGLRARKRVAFKRQLSAPAFLRGKRNAHIRHASVRIHAYAFDKRLLLHAQPQISQQTVPVGLRFVRRSGGIENLIARPAGIAVIDGNLKQIVAPQKPRHLQHVRRAERLTVEVRRERSVHPERKLARALALEEHAVARQDFRLDAARIHGRPFVGIFARIARRNHAGGVKGRVPLHVRMPGVAVFIGETDAVLIQRARQLRGVKPSLHLALPFSRKIERLHFILSLPHSFSAKIFRCSAAP